ncbi:hypothetical protein NDU88_002783 [Pleurodeles waltl]|uniref:Uncharacterized protein n=1 Tax=Pleurodeles waltl TaxID=8319 RepID=A0AAV7UAM8_PLEWA|nr:hypothetical protein NDU88_002781 [Pleurodeles waltl]KAJ1185997.1 hypothetical protein NDU88_002782 [Pleurodeles waltl]KAJ1185998.1 hypothetical protein NDU88_002783 [Pleurodeles waltl]
MLNSLRPELYAANEESREVESVLGRVLDSGFFKESPELTGIGLAPSFFFINTLGTDQLLFLCVARSVGRRHSPSRGTPLPGG